MSILKRTMFIQAIQFGSCGKFEVKLFDQELVTDLYTTAITLDTIEVEFESPDYSQDEFKAMKQSKIAKVKADIMETAKKQCAAIDAESGWVKS
jgi:hypothetical protein